MPSIQPIFPTPGEGKTGEKTPKFRLRRRLVRCGKENCQACPHGPYYWLVWKDKGKSRERYLGKLPEGSVWMLPPEAVLPTPPKLNAIAALRPETTWGAAANGGGPEWHSTVSTFRVDGRGISRLDGALAVWVTLQTIDGRRVYRQVPANGKPEGAETRWYLGSLDSAEQAQPWLDA